MVRRQYTEDTEQVKLPSRLKPLDPTRTSIVKLYPHDNNGRIVGPIPNFAMKPLGLSPLHGDPKSSPSSDLTKLVGSFPAAEHLRMVTFSGDAGLPR